MVQRTIRLVVAVLTGFAAGSPLAGGIVFIGPGQLPGLAGAQ